MKGGRDRKEQQWLAVLDNRGRSMDAEVLFGVKKKNDGDKSELFQYTVTKLQQFFQKHKLQGCNPRELLAVISCWKTTVA